MEIELDQEDIPNSFDAKIELDEVFTKLIALLKKIDRTVCPLVSIRNRGGNEKNILLITSQLNTALIKWGYLTKDQEIVNDNQLRKITYFLILNSDLTAKNGLKNEPKVGHLICLDLTLCLVLDCIWGLNLDRYLCEVIAYGPVTISIELLRSVLDSVKHSGPYPLLERVRDLIFAVYSKIYRLKYERVYYHRYHDALSSLNEILIELTKHYIKPDSSKMGNWGENEFCRYVGYALHAIFQLLIKCLNITNEPCPDFYVIEYNIGAELFVSKQARSDMVDAALEKANFVLITTCQANLKAINVNIYCTWHEFKLHNDKNTTLQQNIANMAYIISEQITKFRLAEDVETETKQMLDAIAIKPQSLTEEIATADIEIVLKNLPIVNDSQKLWFKRFITFDNIFTDHHDTLLTHLPLADSSDFTTLLQAAYSQQNQNIELAKKFIEVLENFERDEQFHLVYNFLQQNGINTLFQLPEFESNLTESLNKSNYLAPKFLLQNCLISLRKLFELWFGVKKIEGGNDYKTLFDLNYQDNHLGPFLLKETYDICNDIGVLRSITEQLIENDIFNIDLIVKDIFLVKLHESVNNNDVKKALFWLHGCQSIYKHFTKYYLPFLLFIVQILRRNDIYTFSIDNIALIELGIEIVTQIVTKIKNEKLLSSEDLQYLEKWLSSEELITRFYFESLFNENPKIVSFLFSGSFSSHNRNWNIGRLLEILPFATLKEWQMISVEILKEIETLQYFQILLDVLSLLRKLVKSNIGLSCLEYSVKNLSVIIKEFICPRVADSYNAELIVWESTCTFLAGLPKEIQENCSFQLVNVLIPLLERLKSKNPEVKSVAALDLIPLKDTEACRLICKKLLEK